MRMDFSWAATERQKGDYDWSAYDGLTAALEKRRLRLDAVGTSLPRILWLVILSGALVCIR